MRLSARIARIQPSITLAISAKAQRLAQAGHDIISFGIGEPDFDTPAHIKEAAILAIQRGASKYTAVAGIPELRAAAAAELSRTHGVTLTPEQIVVSTGAKQCLFNILTALLDDGDEVIVPTPCWPSHVELVRMAGGVAVLCPQRAQDGFALSPEAVARLITPRTRAVLLNSPSNPTGAVYSKESLLGLAEVIRRANNPELQIITDDLYRRLCYAPTQFASFAQLAPDLAARTILVDGVSKAYAMTGWRIGFCAAPLPLATAMQTIQGQVTTNATAVAQHAALAALLGDQAPVAAMVAEFDARRQLMYRTLMAVPGIVCKEPQGAFYCFPDFSAYLHAARGGRAPQDEVALCDYLLSEVGIACVPGSGFFAPGHLRLSYATSQQKIADGLARLSVGLSRLG